LIQDKKTSNWSSDETLSKEFESVGFYISNHPLKDYEDALKQYKVKLFKDFENSSDSESFIAGTIMSVKEKKTSKGNSFAIIKFSDLSKVYELFLFSEILELNREHLIEGKSFLLTVIKDKQHQENRFRRINVRKIVSLDKITELNYTNVEIQMHNVDDLEKLYEVIKEKGNSKIKILIKKKDKDYLFELKDKRKFDYETLKYLNKEHYITKINL
jgi:DNA polymerase-3 subunit alpha